MPSEATLRMMASLKKFNVDVAAAVKDFTTRELVLFHKKMALDALRSLQKKTPVDTGRARGAWLVTVSTPASEAPGGVRSVAQARSEGLTALGVLKPFDVVYLTNNLPYINRLEEGYSKQAPQGMVSLTVEEMRSVVGVSGGKTTDKIIGFE